jgi:hypothetical protein
MLPVGPCNDEESKPNSDINHRCPSSPPIPSSVCDRRAYVDCPGLLKAHIHSFHRLLAECALSGLSASSPASSTLRRSRPRGSHSLFPLYDALAHLERHDHDISLCSSFPLIRTARYYSRPSFTAPHSAIWVLRRGLTHTHYSVHSIVSLPHRAQYYEFRPLTSTCSSYTPIHPYHHHGAHRTGAASSRCPLQRGE